MIGRKKCHNNLPSKKCADARGAIGPEPEVNRGINVTRERVKIQRWELRHSKPLDISHPSTRHSTISWHFRPAREASKIELQATKSLSRSVHNGAITKKLYDGRDGGESRTHLVCTPQVCVISPPTLINVPLYRRLCPVLILFPSFFPHVQSVQLGIRCVDANERRRRTGRSSIDADTAGSRRRRTETLY